MNPYIGNYATKSQLDALMAAANAAIEILRDGISRKKQPSCERSYVISYTEEYGSPLYDELEDKLGTFEEV